MYVRNFRQYILAKIDQTKKDQKDTIKDAKERNDKYQMKYQKEYYIGRIQAFEELYKDCKRYEWTKRITQKPKEMKIEVR